MVVQVLPVSTLNAYIQQVVAADDILADLWIEGEITQITHARSGHIYFTICEADAAISCMMWKNEARRQMFIPKVGESVTIHGQADFYRAQGKLQIRADVFEHQGQGILALQMERLRQQLEAEGLFDPSRKRPLPHFPRRVGVVTSSTGAVWHDIQTVSRRRFPMIELILVPAAVQGAHAPGEIVAAIQHLCSLDSIDVMIVGRGGGSPEDLAPFNDESVARAIYASTIPVVSAVGHETDFSIADMVADVRAATPSAAAELILPHIDDLQKDLSDLRDDLMRLAERRLSDEAMALDRLQQRLIRQAPDFQIARAQQQLDTFQHRLQTVARSELRHRSIHLATRMHLLDALHPGHVLARGFAMVQNAESGSPVKRTSELPNGDVIVNFQDGTAVGTLKQSSTASSSTDSEGK